MAHSPLGRFAGIRSFTGAARIALSDLLSLPDPVHIVCGPISTGGLGSVERNLIAFNAMIESLICLRFSVFNQIPYEPILWKLRAEWQRKYPKKGYCMLILTHFYRYLFQSNKIKVAWFLPGWETSMGARWEHAQCLRCGIEIRYVSEAYVLSLVDTSPMAQAA